MKLTVDEVIEITGGEIVSDVKIGEFSGLGALKEAESSDISFLGNIKYYQDFLSTAAGLVLVPNDFNEVVSGAVIVQVENPSFSFGHIVKAFSKNLQKFCPGVHPNACIDTSVQYDPEKVSIGAGVIIDGGCSIGDGTEIRGGCVINEGVSIGENCLLHGNVTIREYCEVGSGVILQPGCVIGSDGYGYEMIDGRHEKVDQVGIVVIGNDVEIGANTTIDRARFGKTTIGEGSKIDNQVQIAHNVTIGKHCLIVSQVGIAGSTELGDYVTIAAQTGIAGHLKIESRTIVLAKSGVTKDTPAGLYLGYPAAPASEERRRIASLRRVPQLIKDVKKLINHLEE